MIYYVTGEIQNVDLGNLESRKCRVLVSQSDQQAAGLSKLGDAWKNSVYM